MIIKKITFLPVIIFSLLITHCTQSQQAYVKDNYDKKEYMIEMRDGIKLFTAVYSPKDKSREYPIVLTRTPYSCSPYGEDKYAGFLGASKEFAQEGFIFVLQDVRGRYMSEGEFDNMRAFNPNKKSKKDVDESSDTYDTIEWLINNIDNNNKKVGMWGNSYPGFYTIMGTIDAHPNLVCASPQAPISDWFVGDDMHHNGAFSVLMSFNFFKQFGKPRPEPVESYPPAPVYDSPDAYNFFLDHTPIKKLNEEILKNEIPFWDTLSKHGNYDYYWKSRSNLQYLKNIKPALLLVGGFYDAEDMYGPLHIYKAIEQNDKPNNTRIIMGPWTHGSWIFAKGDSLGDFYFGGNTADYYRNEILLPFFKYYLKSEGDLKLNDAYVFDTGKNKWSNYLTWPPSNSNQMNYYFQPNEKLNLQTPMSDDSFSQYLSDPFNPVPYTATFQDSKNFYNRVHLIEDQRYVSTRPDVLTFESEVLNSDITIAGPIIADLFVSTTGTDADLVVKVIDVYPDGEIDPDPNPNKVEMGGYERLVRTEIFRGKFRSSYENPEPFKPNKVTEVKINLNDAFHTFKVAHKIMIQVSSSYFPFFDVNPNTFCDIYHADADKFVKANIKIYHSKDYPSSVKFLILK
ncbi:MAG: CocE/NonD family hydrolase [Ignavibacteriales bacterium]|nr:CocE/NonD family hydrolase [Ignavibacteriales bacterium]